MTIVRLAWGERWLHHHRHAKRLGQFIHTAPYRFPVRGDHVVGIDDGNPVIIRSDLDFGKNSPDTTAKGKSQTQGQTNLHRGPSTLLRNQSGRCRRALQFSAAGITRQNHQGDEHPILMTDSNHRKAQHLQESMLAAIARMFGPGEV